MYLKKFLFLFFYIFLPYLGGGAGGAGGSFARNSCPCQGANQTGVYWGRAFRPLLGAHLRCFTGGRFKFLLFSNF